jgi:hypothetical protein
MAGGPARPLAAIRWDWRHPRPACSVQLQGSDKENAMASAIPLDPVDSDLRNEVQRLHLHLAQLSDAQVLGVAHGADAETLRSAYHRLVRRYHPDAVTGADDELKRILPAVFMRVVEAYQTLRAFAPLVAARDGRSSVAAVGAGNLEPSRVEAPLGLSEPASSQAPVPLPPPQPAAVREAPRVAPAGGASGASDPSPVVPVAVSRKDETLGATPGATPGGATASIHSRTKSPTETDAIVPESTPSESAADRPAPVREALAAARRLAREGDNEAVIKALHGVLARADEPERGEIRLQLARAYVGDPRWRRYGLTLLRDITSEDPTNAEALAILGGVYFREGLLARARATLDRALASDPSHAEASAALRLVQSAVEHRTNQERSDPGPGSDDSRSPWARLSRKIFRKAAGATGSAVAESRRCVPAA